ncbi:hypothetical protein M3Y98_00851800 [Aphelenchoides besseyi]|nr:hypothetical protein M3Y98_00851800 [Aphelenchoides besseyi]KAI6195292.1 hypothetical protein M3Y96_01215300 [Aphelenchoides besseyi]
MRRLNTTKATPLPRRTLRFKSLPSRGSARRRAETAIQRHQQNLNRNGRTPTQLSDFRAQLTSIIYGRRDARNTLPNASRMNADSRKSRVSLHPNSTSFHSFETVDDQLLQELAASAPQQRNWRGILTAFFMIFVISVLIIAAVLILTPLDANKIETKTPLSLKDATGSALVGHIEAMEWMDDSKLMIKVNEVIEQIDFSTTPWQNTTLLDSEALYRHGKVKSTNVIPGTQNIEITYFAEKKEKAYESNTIKRIYNTKTGTFENVGPEKTGNENVDSMLFNPNGAGYVFVHKFNLYYRPLMGSQELTRITTNGHIDYRHGITSWAYQEELFGQDAYWWSLDGEEVAFLSTSLSNVGTYNISWYNNQQKRYPDQQSLRYAKTGVGDQELEKIELSIWRKRDKSLTKLLVEIPENKKVYLMHASYVRLHNQNVLVTVFANRFQDQATFMMCTQISGKCVQSFYQNYEIDGLHQSAASDTVRIAAHTNDSIFTILPHRRPNGDIYNQIARLYIPPDFRNAQESFLAMGDYEVEKILRYDPETEKVFFTAPAPIHRQLHLFSTPAKPQKNSMEAYCVTCGVSPNCTYHETTMSSKSNRFFMNCKGPGPTTVYVANALANNTVEVLAEFGQNSDRELELASKRFPHVIFENVTLSNGHVAYTRIFLPHGVTKETYKKYPVLVYCYSGPNTKSVHEEWLPEMPVDIYFSSTLEYIIVNIDGRGSSGAGWKRRQPMYGHLGTVEVDDQVEATKILLERFKFMDKKRVGIWGWSYGGFVSGQSIVRDDSHLFKCAAMVDAIYTERYMGNASEHAYELTNIARNVTNFHYVKTLLIHGMADDNVHFQHSAELVTALVRENIPFDLMVYPDEMHSLRSVRPHLFDKLISHFKNCFDSLAQE